MLNNLCIVQVHTQLNTIHNSLNMAKNLVKLTIDQDLEEKKIQTVVDLQLAVQQVGY